MDKQNRVYVAGAGGMVGSAIVRNLEKRGYENLFYSFRKDGDLENMKDVEKIFYENHPEYVFMAAAKVGGIYANSIYPAEFIRNNLAIQTNIIECCKKFGVKKVMFLGSSCIYPKKSIQPIKEEYLMTGPLEPTNSAYAMAKLAGIEMCRAYREQYNLNAVAVMPTNLYGTNDNYHEKNSHVIPGLISKIYKAKVNNKPSFRIWGDGTPLREFMHVDDCADACVHVMINYDSKYIINIGTGDEKTIYRIAQMIKDIVKYKGEILKGSSELNGTPRKLLDCSKLYGLNWKPKLTLEEGLKKTVEEYVKMKI